MSIYHLYYLRNYALIGSDDIDAPNDAAAVRIARACGQGQAVEIWNDEARVRVVAPANDVSACR